MTYLGGMGALRDGPPSGTPVNQPPVMNLPQPNPPPFTLEDWASWEGRWELIDGVAYDLTPAPTTTHQGVVGSLYRQLGNLLEKGRKRKGGGGGCRVSVAPVDVFLGASIVEPDVVVVCDPARIRERGIEGAPDLVVEVLSPGTMDKDVTRKRWLYEAAGVPEYLVVHPQERVALLLRLEAGRYVDAARVEWGGILPLLAGRLPIRLE
jgi:Uma2 family endonuclease